MSLTGEGDGMVMPVAPAYGGGGNGFGNGWDAGWWIILIVLFAFGGWGGNGWGGNGNSVATDFAIPYFFNNTDNAVQNGFDQAATAASLAGIQTSLTNGFANAEVSACNRSTDALVASYNNQIASMNQNFTNQLNLNSQLDAMQAQQANCCCTLQSGLKDVAYSVATEACADRAAVKDALTSVLTAMSADVQSIKDQMCQDKIDAKNEEISNLRTQLNMQNLATSQAAQTAQLIADNQSQTSYIVNRVAPYPIPAYTVANPYGYNGCGLCNCN